MHTIQEMSKTPHADVYMLTNVIACCAFCDIGHATIGITNLTKYSVATISPLLSHFEY